MLSTKERMEIFYDVLSRVAPELKPRPSLHAPELERVYDTTLSGLLERVGPLPPYSSVLGVCEDGLPLLVDLMDPSSGSMLIQGDEHTGKAHLLESYLLSIGYLNHPNKVAISVISPMPGLFEHLEELPNCRAVLSSYDRDASELLVELSALAEQRRFGRRNGPVELLALHEMPEFIQNNDYEVNAYLKWLIEHGPSSLVWTIASVKSSQLWRIRKDYYEAFGTYLTATPAPTSLLPARQDSHARLLPGVFTTQLGEELIRLWVPKD